MLRTRRMICSSRTVRNRVRGVIHSEISRNIRPGNDPSLLDLRVRAFSPAKHSSYTSCVSPDSPSVRITSELDGIRRDDNLIANNIGTHALIRLVLGERGKRA